MTTTAPDELPICKGGSGTILPLFNAYGEGEWSTPVQIIVYVVALLWMFLGVGIVADVFMEAIEVITSKDKVVQINGRRVAVKVWNPTVANLSLMALGSSAPEIILTVFEICADGFFAGALGPSTIVGSAAFNGLVIIAVCVVAINANETRSLQHMGVFFVTAVFSIFAYLWMLVILVGSSPNVIEWWEALITVLFFPILLIIAWQADKGRFACSAAGDVEGQQQTEEIIIGIDTGSEHADFLTPFETARLLKGTIQPGTDVNEAKDIAEAELFKQQHPEGASRAQYRINAMRTIVGSTPTLPNFELAERAKAKAKQDNFYARASTSFKKLNTFGFESVAVAVKESCGTVDVTVIRMGSGIDSAASVTYATADGTAVAGEDYVHVQGVLDFAPGETTKTITIKIVDDEEPEDDEVFTVRLYNPSGDYHVAKGRDIMEIVILDDDRPGVLGFETDRIEILESSGIATIPVHRVNGCKGTLTVDFATHDGSATAPHDYIASAGTLTFADGETRKIIEIPIVDDDLYEKDEKFVVKLENAKGCQLSEDRLEVIILNDDEKTSTIDKVTALLNVNYHRFKIGKHSWGNQFSDALQWPEQGSGVLAVVLHVASLPWKIFGALIPPTVFASGWVTFVFALVEIAILTVFIADMANLVGCAIGLKSEVTAITFVALGTSLPDTFASRLAAISSPTADASIVNVTGSNSVNVFLGVGIAWLIASIYWPAAGPNERWLSTVPLEIQQKYPGGIFYVDSGSLSFSVVVFCLCEATCLISLYIRRRLYGGELGGPHNKLYAAFLVCLWFLYIILSSLQASDKIRGF